jgi:hypothetical protein
MDRLPRFRALEVEDNAPFSPVEEMEPLALSWKRRAPPNRVTRWRFDLDHVCAEVCKV